VVYLELEDLLHIAERTIGNVEARDLGLLEAAAARPRASAFGEDAYVSVLEKAAALIHSIARNRALVDGNKRLGWLATVVFYGLNDVVLDAPDGEAYELVMAVARSEPPVKEIAAALATWR